MQIVERSALVTYTAAQMFTLVNDVERYPEFLPWCAGAQVQDVSATERTATLRVARGVLKAEFTTHNQLTLGKGIHDRAAQRFEHRVERGCSQAVLEFELDAELDLRAAGTDVLESPFAV